MLVTYYSISHFRHFPFCPPDIVSFIKVARSRAFGRLSRLWKFNTSPPDQARTSKSPVVAQRGSFSFIHHNQMAYVGPYSMELISQCSPV